jgi:hypothetical protein
MHGGPGSGAPLGNRNAWKHGRRSRAAIEERRAFRALLAEALATLGRFNEDERFAALTAAERPV